MDFKKIYEELNISLHFSPNMKLQQAQREQMAVMTDEFYHKPPFGVWDGQISKFIRLWYSSLHILDIESLQFSQSSNSALVNHNDSGRQGNKGGNKGSFNGNKSNQHCGTTATNRD